MRYEITYARYIMQVASETVERPAIGEVEDYAEQRVEEIRNGRDPLDWSDGDVHYDVDVMGIEVYDPKEGH